MGFKDVTVLLVEDHANMRVLWRTILLGFGIRKVPGGWMWNVSGLDSVQLTFADGKRFRIGTDEPGALEAAGPGSAL